MILYRYFGTHAFETLQAAELKTSRISSFNDSFEFLYVTVGKTTQVEAETYLDSHLCDPIFHYDLIRANQESANPRSHAEMKKRLSDMRSPLAEDVVKAWRKIVEKTELPLERKRQIIDEELRAICFSKPNSGKTIDEILLWSHYADKHKGIRIGFEFPDEINERFKVREVIYQKNRVEVVFSLGSECPALEALEKSALVKCEVWRYEQEFRLLTKTTLCIMRNGEYFLTFDREWVRSVDFGVFCPHSEVKRIVGLLKLDYPRAVARRAVFHKTEYAFEYKQVDQ